MTAARDLVAELEARIRPLETELNRAWWRSSTHATPEAERQRAEIELRLRDVLADSAAFAAINDALDDPATEPLVARQLTMLRDQFATNQISPELRRELVELSTAVDSTFSAFRGEIDGRAVTDNEIALILRGSDDADERRRAWEASKQVGREVAEQVREGARLRNRAARSLGYRDHFELALATSELDEAQLFATLEEVDRATLEPYTEWKSGLDEQRAARFGCAVDELRPWHYDDPFFQSPPAGAAVDLDPFFAERDVKALSIRTFDGIGLDVRPVVDRSDLLPRDGKNQHAFCIDIDRAGDVRVLANVVANEYWMETMLHELGHAVYDCETDSRLAWLLRTMHALTTEGVAILFGHLSRSPEWLHRVVGLSDAEIDGLRLHHAHRVGLLVFVRWVLVMTHFERSLYADPEADHNARWWELVARFQQVRPPADRDAPDWAAKIHIASAPVYYQNYLYGQLVASQLTHAITTRVGGFVDQPAAGRFLVDEVFRPGASLRWDHLVEQATGEPLTAAYLARELAG